MTGTETAVTLEEVEAVTRGLWKCAISILNLGDVISFVLEVSEEDLIGAARAAFESADIDGDGTLSVEEFDLLVARQPLLTLVPHFGFVVRRFPRE